MTALPFLRAACCGLVFVSALLLAQQNEEVLFDSQAGTLVGSKFGPIATFQRALSVELGKCGKPTVIADGKLGTKTQKAIVDFQRCRIGTDDKLLSKHGELTVGLWRAVLPTESLPNVVERSFVLWLSHEGTDYDDMEWNFGTADEASGLTWGPYGATVGYGNEVRGILAKIEREQPGLIEKVFANESSVVKQLIMRRADDGYSILKPVFDNRSRRAEWPEMFRQLGEHKEVREAYDWYAFQSPDWLQPPLRKLYGLLNDPPKPTEVDFAFFVDIAMHMSLSEARISKTRDAIAATEREHALSSGERRRVISRALVPTHQVEDRLGRNVVYYVDAIGADNLSTEEKNAWSVRSAMRASQCGLLDREFLPDFVK